MKIKIKKLWVARLILFILSALIAEVVAMIIFIVLGKNFIVPSFRTVYFDTVRHMVVMISAFSGVILFMAIYFSYRINSWVERYVKRSNQENESQATCPPV